MDKLTLLIEKTIARAAKIVGKDVILASDEHTLRDCQRTLDSAAALLETIYKSQVLVNKIHDAQRVAVGSRRAPGKMAAVRETDLV